MATHNQFLDAVELFKTKGSLGTTHRTQKGKTQVVPFLTIADTDEDVVKRFLEGFDIDTKIYTKKRDGRQDLYHMNYASAKGIISILQKVLPYVIGTDRENDIDQFLKFYECQWNILLARPTSVEEPEPTEW